MPACLDLFDGDKEGLLSDNGDPDPSGTFIRRGSSQLDLLWEEMQNNEGRSFHRAFEMEDSSDEDDDSAEQDPELIRRTESNRYIPLREEESSANVALTNSPKSQSPAKQHRAVFSKERVQFSPDRILRTQYYGTDKAEGEPGSEQCTLNRRTRSYLVACDFSSESLVAVDWTINTMMRDGDELYIATVISREDNSEVGKTLGLSYNDELEVKSDAMTLQIKSALCGSQLRDVKLTTYVMAGRVKNVLKKLIRELHLTLVVCGDRNRGAVKGLLMGSVSMYLVYMSPVPVSVVRPAKTKKNKKLDFDTGFSVEETHHHLQLDELNAHF